jgi:hypothetical protein
MLDGRLTRGEMGTPLQVNTNAAKVCIKQKTNVSLLQSLMCYFYNFTLFASHFVLFFHVAT